ncbi:glyoxal or galactose oxidase [Monoraphidium neglectum]|uniref:Glyoxal or galactose oxidase n=1 Tax=Monoraphidium neglectum TaxID=145388 RepID=A0A0D2MRI8_9CHLO|nr:glyoxal or galactose oxidase [Monoraphidium neglectum]KIZ05205.1 glyoxal or galactose oxidase [Monoraphidium neglectum]|eukprot:XP_013904224.1 glyoxal or galactose oxidase [Monoraphidium neglectum]
MNRIVMYDHTLRRTSIKANLTAQRWYPTALALPNGDVWVPGGTWAQKPNGTWPKAAGADVYRPYDNRVTQVPLNKKLWEAAIGNWYMGSLVLPSGKVATMNMNMMQVVDPYTGAALAEAPGLPDPVENMVWEFPRMGPQVMLRADVITPGKPMRYEFMAFGGSFIDAALRKDIAKCGPVTCDREKGEQRTCSEYSVRIGLVLHPNGRHVFDRQWVVEKMPGPRCIFDGVVLPNGHVVLIGGQQRGIGDLTNATHYNGGNQPWNKPWIYNPYAKAGQRYSIPGATTKIARLYHSVAQLTSQGDLLATGTSNAKFWESSDSKDFSRTPLGVNEYRQELFLPPYLFRANRPARAAPEAPSWVPYGGTFQMGYRFPDAPEQTSDSERRRRKDAACKSCGSIMNPQSAGCVQAQAASALCLNGSPQPTLFV